MSDDEKGPYVPQHAATGVTIDQDGVTITIEGVSALPIGSTIVITIGQDGPRVATEAPEPKRARYINGGKL